MNDYRRLKQEADIEQVVSALGIEVFRRGPVFMMRCPHPDHKDEHPSCYFKQGWNNVYCNSCQRKMEAIDLIMYTNHCEYGEAADFLWELEGRPEWYHEDWKNARKRAKEFSLSGRERQLIGLKPNDKRFLNETEYKVIVRNKCMRKMWLYDKTDSLLNGNFFEKERQEIKAILERL